MKFAYLKYLVFGLAIAASILSGCGDDATKDLTPKITIDASTMADNKEFIIKDGVAGTFTVKFVANKGADGKDLQTFSIQSVVDNETRPAVSRTISGSTFNWDSTFQTITRTPATVKYIFTVKDKDGKEASFSRTYKTKADGGPVITKPNAITATLSNANDCLDTDSGNIYSNSSGAGQSSNIDITYLFTDAAWDNIVSPAARANKTIFGAATVGGTTKDVSISWGSVSTELKSTSLTQVNFNELKDQDQAKLAEAFTAGGAIDIGNNNPVGSRATGEKGYIVPGKVLAYKSKGKYGLILVNSVAGKSNPTGSMNITVLRQK